MQNDDTLAPRSMAIDVAQVLEGRPLELVPLPRDEAGNVLDERNIVVPKIGFLSFLKHLGGVAFLERMLPSMLGKPDAPLPPALARLIETLRTHEESELSVRIGEDLWRMRITGDGSQIPADMFGSPFLETLEAMQQGGAQTGQPQQLLGMLQQLLGGAPPDAGGDVGQVEDLDRCEWVEGNGGERCPHEAAPFSRWCPEHAR